MLALAFIASSLCNTASAVQVTHTNYVTQYQYHQVNVFVDQNGVPYSTATEQSSGAAEAAPTAQQPTSTVELTSYAQSEETQEAYNSLSHSHSAAVPNFAYVSQAPAEALSSGSSTPAALPSSTPSSTTSTSIQSSEPETSTTSLALTTSPTAAPEPSTSSTPSKTTSSEPTSTGGSGQTFSGDATYYDVGLGACGVTNTDSELIAALNVEQFNGFGSMSNGNPVCGKTATLHYQGKSVTVTIQDKCPGCKYGDLDLSPAAFNQLSDPGAGRIQITWSFN